MMDQLTPSAGDAAFRRRRKQKTENRQLGISKKKKKKTSAGRLPPPIPSSSPPPHSPPSSSPPPLLTPRLPSSLLPRQRVSLDPHYRKPTAPRHLHRESIREALTGALAKTPTSPCWAKPDTSGENRGTGGGRLPSACLFFCRLRSSCGLDRE